MPESSSCTKLVYNQDKNEIDEALYEIVSNTLQNNKELMDMQWCLIDNNEISKVLQQNIYFMHWSETHNAINRCRNKLKYRGARVQAPKLLKISKYDLKKYHKILEAQQAVYTARN